MTIYDRNGQPYDADLVEGEFLRALQADNAALREGFANVRLTLYGLALDARQAEVMQRAIDKIDRVVKPEP